MLGEFSYIVLLRRHLKIPVSEGIRSLFEARLFDLQFVIVGGTFGLLTMGRQSTGYVLTILVLAGVLIIVNRVLFTVLPKGIEPIWTFIVRICPRRYTALLDSAGHRLGEVSLQLDRFRCLRLLLKALTFSLCTYGINLSCHLLLLSTLNVNQRLSMLLVVISVVMIAAWFPFSLSGFGVIEGSWAASLVMFADMEVGSCALSWAFYTLLSGAYDRSVGIIGFCPIDAPSQRASDGCHVENFPSRLIVGNNDRCSLMLSWTPEKAIGYRSQTRLGEIPEKDFGCDNGL